MYQQPGYGYGFNQNYNQIALQKSLELILEAIGDEKSDELFYDYLISVAPNRKEKNIISSIRDDEKKHNRLFKGIYKSITGKEAIVAEDEEFIKPRSYLDGIERALFGELKAVEKYRKIRRGLPGRYYRDILFDIITDELKHSNKYNFIFTENKKMRNSEEEPYNVNNPDETLEYISPLVERAQEEFNEGINPEHLFQEFILSGLLVGKGYTPSEAITQVEKWENNGTSEILKKSKIK
ncbi:ferritin-like domain-containing protein [Clostridium sp. DL1XJH146]